MLGVLPNVSRPFPHPADQFSTLLSGFLLSRVDSVLPSSQSKAEVHTPRATNEFVSLAEQGVFSTTLLGRKNSICGFVCSNAECDETPVFLYGQRQTLMWRRKVLELLLNLHVPFFVTSTVDQQHDHMGSQVRVERFIPEAARKFLKRPVRFYSTPEATSS